MAQSKKATRKKAAPKKKAAKAAPKAAPKPKSETLARGEWREGTSAQFIIEATKAKSGVTAEKVCDALITSDIASTNPSDRVKVVLRAALSRGVVRREDDRYFYVAPDQRTK